MSSRRQDLGSWLQGTPAGPSAGRAPGIDLPESGPGSRAGLGRRVVALLVDWGLSLAISAAFLEGHPMGTLGVFALTTVVLVSTLGHTIGHRLLGLTVARVRDTADRPDRAPAPGLVPGLMRTFLLCLVLPAAVWDGQGRGMHDVAAGTVLVRR
ncbi:RDD family protein [Cellulomonas bogoriensis]|nr:transporter [Cellulomonas bogoriensis]